MKSLLLFFYDLLSAPHLLLIVIIVAVTFKIHFVKKLIPLGLRSTTSKKMLIFLLGTIIGSLFGDLAWIIKLLRTISFPEISYHTVLFFIRVSWAFLIMQYYSLALFIQTLSEKRFKLQWINYILTPLGFISSGYFIYMAFCGTTLSTEHERSLAKSFTIEPPLEMKMMRFVIFYVLNLLVLPSLFITIRNLRTKPLPKILRKQLWIFIVYLICPYLVIEALQAIYFGFAIEIDKLYPVVSVSTLLLIYAVHYCLKRVMSLRFLNGASHVQSPNQFSIATHFTASLEQLAQVTNVQELNHITQSFFKASFHVPLHSTNVYIRNDTSTEPLPDRHEIRTVVEHNLSMHEETITHCLKKLKVLIYDDISFTYFYEETPRSKIILSFLEKINAEVFIPIYAQQKMIGYIIIDKDSRPHDCYSNIEGDEMHVFGHYLGTTINLLSHNDINSLTLQTKEIENTLYLKQQESQLFKESVRTCLRNKIHQSVVGIIFYKNRHFTLGNQAAQELIPIDLNQQEGHPLTKAIKQLVHHVAAYKSPQTLFTPGANGKQIMLSCMQHIDHNTLFITVSYPDVTDIISHSMQQLHDPNQWDGLLYLETTKAGAALNQMIPGAGEQLLNLKINILTAAISKKGLLINAPQEDVEAYAHIIHHMSQREPFFAMQVEPTTSSLEYAMQLFGVNPLFAPEHTARPLLERANGGTLVIKDIFGLPRDIQQQLAYVMQTGIYQPVKSEQKKTSNIRIIGTALQAISKEQCAPQLFEELHKTTLTIPPLSALNTADLEALAMGFAQQATNTEVFKNLLSLTSKELQKIVTDPPESLHSFKNRVQNILIQKSKEHNIYNEAHFDPAFQLHDPELVEAARLGKHALKDHKIMNMLWHKFKNQNKIATFLGVNRSSVNRRCKEYNLTE